MKIAIAAVLTMAFLGSTGVCQIRPQMNGPEENQAPPKPQRKKEKGPRALGVLEITANGKARLIPISILVGDKWFDAGLYMATPRPMALESDTVYEGFAGGEPQGLFTVTAAQEVGENWYGLGKWKPKGVEVAKKPKVETPQPSSDDERPVLKRSKPASSQSDTTQATAPPTSTPAPKETAPASPAPAPQTKPTETAAGKPAPKQSVDAPNRPILRRGAPGVEQAEGISVSSADDFGKPAGAKNASAKPVAAAPAIVKTLAAISDASGPEPRSYAFFVQSNEREGYMEKITRIASDSLQKFVSTRFKGAVAPTVTEANSRLDIFDLTTSNNPVLVLTAKVPASAAAITATKKTPIPKRASQTAVPVATPLPSNVEYYVTVVARVNYDGDLRKVFDSVTDSTRLDAYPKMDLIDAVDANGDGAGELLFRETYDSGRAYVVYRVGMDQLWPLFESAQK